MRKQWEELLKKPTGRWAVRLLPFLVVVVIILVFQNCTQPLEHNVSDFSTIQDNAPFAYDTSIDQIAYMSCSELPNGGFNESAYFTFRAGAYQSFTGLALNRNFLNYVSGYSSSDQEDILGGSQQNTNTQLQFSVRAYDNFQNIFTSSGTGVSGQDYMSFFVPLGDPMDNIDNVLVQLAGQPMQYLTDEDTSGARIEASLYFTSNWTLTESLREFLGNNTQGLLGLTYEADNTTNSYVARSPADFLTNSPSPSPTPLPLNSNNTTSVYGRGIAVRFTQPNVTGIYPNYPNYVLAGVTEEVDLSSRGVASNSGTWVCDPALQFKILPDNTAITVAEAGCVMGPDPSPAPQNLLLARHSFKIGDWYIDLANRCLIPKASGTTGCYGPGYTPPVVNTQTGLCSGAATTTGSSTAVCYDLAAACSGPASSGGTCLHYASVCYRMN